MNTDPKQCSGACQKVLPIQSFRFRTDRMLYHTRCYACESEENAAWYQRRKEAAGGKLVRVKKTPEPAWAVPAHESTDPEADIVFRAWRCAMPVAAMRCAL